MMGLGVVPVYDWDKEQVLEMLRACDLRMPDEIVLVYGDTEIRVSINKVDNRSARTVCELNGCPFEDD